MRKILPVLWTIGAICGIGSLIGWFTVSGRVGEVQKKTGEISELLEKRDSEAIESLATQMFQRFERDMDISVPSTKEAEKLNKQFGEIIISIRRNGDIALNGLVVSNEDLSGRLNTISELYRDQAIVLRADAKASFQNIINVVDEIKKAGMWNIAFATVRPEASQ